MSRKYTEDEPTAMQPGWSKAAKRRAGQDNRHSNPFGEYVGRGDDGASIYEDTAFGGGRVVIYDEN